MKECEALCRYGTWISYCEGRTQTDILSNNVLRMIWELTEVWITSQDEDLHKL
jgi:hypothetical protein